MIIWKNDGKVTVDLWALGGESPEAEKGTKAKDVAP